VEPLLPQTRSVMHKMSLLSEIENICSEHDLSVETVKNIYVVRPRNPNGFELWFMEDSEEYIVGYGAWHEHFEKNNYSEALSCFRFGLSKKCRIKVLSKAGSDYKWVMESLARILHQKAAIG
jgi:hypothetical protein